MLSKYSFLIPILLLLNASLHVVFAENALITEVCRQANNPDLCKRSLSSDPRSATADRKTLGQIAIEKSEASATSTRDLVKSLAEPVTTPRFKYIYHNCLNVYDDALDILATCTKNLVSKEFKKLGLNAWSVTLDAMSCDVGFWYRNPVKEPPTLKEANQELKDLANVVMIIASELLAIR